MSISQKQDEPPAPRRISPWLLVLAVGWPIIIFLAILLPHRESPPQTRTTGGNHAPNPAGAGAVVKPNLGPGYGGSVRLTALSADQIVANKVKLFAKRRLSLVRTMAQRLNQPVPPEIEDFFKALQGDDWEEIRTRFRAIATRAGKYEYSTSYEHDLAIFWRPVQEALGAAEQARLWPAQQLLDYGNAVLGSLRPGMAYVGGTDPGCFIPTMMNETSGGERHVVFTQNALADSDYMDYLRSLYPGELNMPGPAAAQKAFQDYVIEAQKRFLHDQQFPNEPKQLRPGEILTPDETGNLQVRGVTSVMAINERLLQNILQLNPNLSLAMEESFSLPSTYTGAVPLGPIFELRAEDPQNPLTSDAVSQSLDYWRAAAKNLLADPASANTSTALNAWSHDLSAQASLFAANRFPAEAEQAFQIATEISPGNPSTANAYADLLLSQNRPDEAAHVAANALKSAPDNQALKDLVQRVSRLQNTPPR